MLWVSELPVSIWPPCADVRLRWPATRTRPLVFIYIYAHNPYENGPGAVLCPLLHPAFFSLEKTLGFCYAHGYLDELCADWLVYNERSCEQRRDMANCTD